MAEIIEFFGRKRESSVPPLSYDQSIHLQTTFGNEIIATGQWTQNGFILMADSYIKKTTTLKSNKGILKTRKELLDKGLLIESGKSTYYKLTKHIFLSSPSTAARLVHGNDRDGLTDWKSTEGESLSALLN